MAEFQELVQTLDELFANRLQKKVDYVHGLMGDGNGRVRVSTIPGSPDVDYVYVRPDRLDNRVFKVFNKRVEGQDGDPIVIGSFPWEPDLVQVLDLDWQVYKGVGWGDDVMTTTRHGTTHQWRDGAPGLDTFDVYRRQFGDLKTYSIASGTMNVGLSPYSLNINQVQYQWPGTHGLSLAGAVPAGTGTAQMALVYWSPVSGTTAGFLGVATGTAGSSADAAFLNRPVTPKGAIPSAFVKLRGGQTSIDEFDIWDAREPFRLGDFYGPGSYLWENGVTITTDLLVKADDIGKHNNVVVSMSSDTAIRGSFISFLRAGAGDTAVSSGHTIGQMSFAGHDGTNYVASAGISAFVDGTVATGVVPMRMDLYISGTSWDNRETRLRLATGTVSIGDVARTGDVDINLFANQIILQPTTDSTDFYQILAAAGGTPVFNVDTTNESVGIGTSAATFVRSGTTMTTRLFIESPDASAFLGFTLLKESDSRTTAVAILRSRAGATATQDGDAIGSIQFMAHDGTDYNRSAQISVSVEGAVSANTTPGRMIFSTATGNAPAFRMGIWPVGTVKIGPDSVPSGQLHIDQSDDSAAIPVFVLDQADVSEEMIEFVSTIGTGNAIEAVGAKVLTTTHFIKVTLPGALTRYIPVGTIA